MVPNDTGEYIDLLQELAKPVTSAISAYVGTKNNEKRYIRPSTVSICYPPRTRCVMTKDKNTGLSDECIYCGTYTAATIRDIPVCRACAKELETDLDPPSLEQSGGSKA
jgi:hypothetical protein